MESFKIGLNKCVHFSGWQPIIDRKNVALHGFIKVDHDFESMDGGFPIVYEVGTLLDKFA